MCVFFAVSLYLPKGIWTLVPHLKCIIALEAKMHLFEIKTLFKQDNVCMFQILKQYMYSVCNYTFSYHGRYYKV